MKLLVFAVLVLHLEKNCILNNRNYEKNERLSFCGFVVPDFDSLDCYHPFNCAIMTYIQKCQLYKAKPWIALSKDGILLPIGEFSTALLYLTQLGYMIAKNPFYDHRD